MSTSSSSSVAPHHYFATGHSLLDRAAEQFIVNKDFETAFGTCDRALQNLANIEDDRCEEFKAGFCILGIQALAELNEWRQVLPWVLQQYERQERIPAKIIQMCILLYSKVGEAAVMLDVARVWLHCLANSRVSGFGTVAELYLLHVLIPLGHTEEARELLGGAVGHCALTEEQRQTAQDVVEEKDHQKKLATGIQSSEIPLLRTTPQGAVLKLEAILKYLHRKLLVTGSGSFPLRKLLLIAVLVYMIFIRMDPGQTLSCLMNITVRLSRGK